jgi:hypothetical protein
LWPGCHVPYDGRAVVEGLSPNGEGVGDLLLQIVNEKEPLRDALLHLLRIIWKKRLKIYLKPDNGWCSNAITVKVILNWIACFIGQSILLHWIVIDNPIRNKIC